MIKKLYKNEYGSTPRSDKGLDTAAPEAPSRPAAETAKAKELDKKSEISDNYDDDFDLDDVNPVKGKTEAKKEAAKKESSDDDWGLEDDWGEPAPKKSEPKEKEKASAPLNAKSEIEKKKEEEESKRRNMFDNKELEDLPTLGEGKEEKIKDEFNQVLSTSKENGGFLASMGLKKGEGNDESIIDDSQEEDPHKKSDLFDTSKDKIAKGGKV